MEVADATTDAAESENHSTAAVLDALTVEIDKMDCCDVDDSEQINRHDFEGLEMPPRDSAQPDDGRARHGALARRPSEQTDPDEPAAAADGAAASAIAQDAMPAPSGKVDELEWHGRADIMFKVESGGPVASGRLPAAKTVTKEMLHDAWEAIKAVAKSRGRQLTQSYGNFDKLCGLGWLLGDVICGRLVDGDVAYRVGRRLGKPASGLQAEFAAPLRRFGKRKFATEEVRERERAAAAAEEAELRCEEIDVDFDLPPPAAAATAAAATASATAASAAAQPASELPPPPLQPPLQPPPTPRSERVELLKALMEAEARVEQARRDFADATGHRDHLRKAYDYACDWAANPRRLAQIPLEKQQAWIRREESKVEDSRRRYITAERDLGPFEDGVFWAEHAAKEARIDLHEYERACVEKDRWQLEMAELDEQWCKMQECIEEHNEDYDSDDPEYWGPELLEHMAVKRCPKCQKWKWKCGVNGRCE